MVFRLIEKARRAADKLSFLAPALIRLTMGSIFIGTGWGKLHTLPDVTSYFAELHIPMPHFNAVLAASTEFFGGLLLLVGLGSRLVSLPLAFTMVVAILTAKRPELEGVTSLLGFEEWSYLVMFLVIALRGPGALSLDALLARIFARQAAPLPRPVLAPSPVAA
jgi:putative oxidoreductase